MPIGTTGHSAHNEPQTGYGPVAHFSHYLTMSRMLVTAFIQHG
jgi:hypothetical protein